VIWGRLSSLLSAASAFSAITGCKPVWNGIAMAIDSFCAVRMMAKYSGFGQLIPMFVSCPGTPSLGFSLSNATSKKAYLSLDLSSYPPRSDKKKTKTKDTIFLRLHRLLSRTSLPLYYLQLNGSDTTMARLRDMSMVTREHLTVPYYGFMVLTKPDRIGPSEDGLCRRNAVNLGQFDGKLD
jgi:hypothetical protein